MGRGHGQWWSDRSGAPSWTSGTFSLAITAALFAAAFASMMTVRITSIDVSPRDPDPPIVVHLAPPIVAPPVVVPPAPPRTIAPARPAPAAPTTVPTAIPPVPSLIDRAIPVPAAPALPGAPTRGDTTGLAGPPSADPLRPSLTQIGPMRSVPTFPPGVPSRGGAPIAPAGVTQHMGTLTTAARDAIATATMASIPALAALRKATPDEKRALQAQQAPGIRSTDRAARLPGEPMAAPLMNGGYAVAMPLVSIDAPILSPGPSPAERRRNAALDAEYQLRLRRLQDRAALVRDSIRADSLKRDSLSRARIRP